MYRQVRKLLIGILLVVMGVAGCTEQGSLGRFKRAPITSLILPNLGVVDEDPEVFAGARDPEAKDLIPDRAEYVIGPGDVLDLSVFELFSANVEWGGRKQVSDTGRITLPVIGTFRADGQTELELSETIKNKLSPEFIKDPKVSVVVTGSRERVYSIQGAVAGPGRYPLGESDFRISEAMAQAGGIPPINADYGYVIRRVSAAQVREQMEEAYGQEQDVLDFGGIYGQIDDDTLPAMPMPPVEGDEAEAPSPPDSGVDEEYRELKESAIGEAESELVVPGYESAFPDEPVEPLDEVGPSESTPEDDEDELLESVTPMLLGSSEVHLIPIKAGAALQESLTDDMLAIENDGGGMMSEKRDEEVVYAVDEMKPLKVIREGGHFRIVPADAEEGWQAPPLPDEGEPSVAQLPDRPGYEREKPSWRSKERGRWSGVGDEELASRMHEIIRIDLKKLRGGDMTQNIVIKAGDEIRIPVNVVGVFYVMGQVARPGAHSLSGGRMTIKHAIAVAGPLTALAAPERCDIIRRIGDDREVFQRVNLRKLMDGTAHDIFLKPNDIINVGSHPVARWIATVRNSFRATYGFGFVYDRNFSAKDNDAFR